MLKIKDMIIVSDLDGTLLSTIANTPRREISKANLTAIRKFRELGGTFTIATGRTAVHAIDIAKEAGITGAIVCGNGSEIFHVGDQKTLWCKYFEDGSLAEILELIRKFPEIGVIISDIDNNFYALNETPATIKRQEYHINQGHPGYTKITPEEFPSNARGGWIEISKSLINPFLVWLGSDANHQYIRFALSGDAWFDLLPLGVSKGLPFEKLVTEVYGKKLENSIAIGDYDNDIEMLKRANLPVAVENATDSVKAVAKMVVKSNKDDGVADLINYLIENYD